MTDTVQILETRVREAVQRLGRLADDRAALELELAALRRRLEEADAAEVWPIDRAELTTSLRDILGELRADGPPSGAEVA